MSEVEKVWVSYTAPKWVAQSSEYGWTINNESLLDCIRFASNAAGCKILACPVDGAGRGLGEWSCEPGKSPVELDTLKPGTWPEGAKP